MSEELYKFYFYLIYGVLAFATILFSLNLDIKGKVPSKLGNILGMLSLFLFIILFGFRNEDVGTDTIVYIWQFQNYQLLGIDIDFLYSFLLMATLYLTPLYYASKIYSSHLKFNLLFIVFSFVSLFFFETLGINIIRQGVSLSFFLLGVALYIKKNIINRYILIIFFIAIGFHFTTIIPTVLFLIIVFFKSLKIVYFYIMYLITLLLSSLNLSLLDFLSFLNFLIVDERRSGYVSADANDVYDVGFKPQIVLFNTFFVIISTYILRYKQVDSYDYKSVIKFFLAMSSIFFLTFQIPYSDRWGVMSWIVIPFLLSPLYLRTEKLKFATFSTIILIVLFLFFNLQEK